MPIESFGFNLVCAIVFTVVTIVLFAKVIPTFRRTTNETTKVVSILAFVAGFLVAVLAVDFITNAIQLA